MVVALGALDLHAQEDARHLGRGRHGVLVQVVQQKVDRPVVVRFARLVGSPGADELIDHLVVRLVVQEALPQVLLHPLAIDQRSGVVSAGATDEQDGPDGGPVVGVLFDILVGFQQLVDELGLFVRGSVIDKRQSFLGRGNSAQHVQKDAADPLPVGRLGRRAQFSILPALADVLVDVGDNPLVFTGKSVQVCRPSGPCGQTGQQQRKHQHQTDGSVASHG